MLQGGSDAKRRKCCYRGESHPTRRSDANKYTTNCTSVEHNQIDYHFHLNHNVLITETAIFKWFRVISLVAINMATILSIFNISS